MDSQYTVPTIPQNLSKEETIVQIVEVLDHLNAITQDIFLKVNERIKINNEKLSNFSRRVDNVSSKVEHLKGDKKAKTVFSSSKYPAIDVNKDYVSVFKNASYINLQRHEVKHAKYLSSTYEPLTKLQFYHVKLPTQKSTIVSEGLGEVPGNIKCINDLLLFNSGKNVYTDFALTDSLKKPETIRFREYNNTSELGAAPISINERSSLQQTNKDNYFYTPKAEELPALDVPLDLPDLPGIADDLRYELDFGSSIAPSAINQNFTSNASEVTLNLPSIAEIKDAADIWVPLPPPPPPPEELLQPPAEHHLPLVNEPTSNRSVNEPAKTDKTPVSDLTVNYELPNIEKNPSPPNIAPVNDSRASLMDEIRKAGGSQKAKLKKTEQVKTNNKVASSGDLMADLHSKLMMRRKGISGAKNVEQGNGSNIVTPDSTLARISSMIPPPTVKSDQESNVSTDDEEWNDD